MARTTIYLPEAIYDLAVEHDVNVSRAARLGILAEVEAQRGRKPKKQGSK
ncbi:hypothetical protein [Mycolicibacterium sp.]